MFEYFLMLQDDVYIASDVYIVSDVQVASDVQIASDVQVLGDLVMRRYVASESVLMNKDDDKCLQSPLYEMASKTKMFLLHFSSSFF